MVKKNDDGKSSLGTVLLSQSSHLAESSYKPHPDIAECAMRFLHNKGYTVEKLLGKGFYGSVYIACRKNGCNYVLKVGNISDDEVLLQKKASLVKNTKGVGIAPKVYEHGSCENITYMIQEKIDGSTLLDSFTPSKLYNINYIIEAIESGNVLLDQKGIKQNDFKANNIMIDNKNKCVRIIDYGISRQYNNLSEDEKFKIMRGHCALLLKSFEDDSLSQIGRKMPIIEFAENPKNIEKYYNWMLDLNKAIYKWFFDNYNQLMKQFISQDYGILNLYNFIKSGKMKEEFEKQKNSRHSIYDFSDYIVIGKELFGEFIQIRSILNLFGNKSYYHPINIPEQPEDEWDIPYYEYVAKYKDVFYDKYGKKIKNILLKNKIALINYVVEDLYKK